MSKPTLKRRIISTDLSDSENVDPNILKSSPSKRKRLDTDDDELLSKPTKTSKFILKPISRSVSSTPLGSSRLQQSSTPRAVLGQRTANAGTPLSAPPAAGRSPVRPKARGVRRLGLSSASVNSSPYARIKSRKSTAAPFSLATALRGTIPSAARPSSRPAVSQPIASSIEESLPSSWLFEIHEDTPDEEAQILMEHSACTLDISSDDEERARLRSERGKENVAPGPITTAVAPVERTDVMSDGARTPLGDLDIKEYFAEGCDEASVFVIRDDEDAETVIDEQEERDELTTCSSMPTVSKQDLDSLLESLVPAKEQEQQQEQENVVDEKVAAEIEIWESSSAADEEENRAQDSIFA